MPPAALLVDGPGTARDTVVLAHGAGAPMDSPFMTAIAAGLAARGLRVVRFEFPYMQARRGGRIGRGGPPDRPAVLAATWRGVIEDLGGGPGLVLGGKSLGGRVASLIADDVGARGLVCLGYPFHPPGRPERPRTAHLARLATPALFVQGARDPFGTPEEIAGYDLSPAIRVAFLEDGDHSFAPRVRAGHSLERNLARAIDDVAGFVAGLAAASR